jgi:peptidyl-prolyl cis-trans isomerase C
VKPLAALILLIVPLSLACRNKAAAPAPPAAVQPPAANAAGSQAGSPLGGPAGSEAAAGGPTAVKPVPAELPAVLARVNGEAIERWEFEYVVHGVEGQAGRPIPPDQRDQVFRGLLDQLVAFRLLSQEARSRKLNASDADVKARIDEIRKSFPSEDAFLKALASEGSSLEKLQQQTRMTLLVSKVLEAEIGPKVSVQPKDIDAFYQQNLDRFKEGETVHASHILIAIPEKADAAQKQQSRAQAEGLLKQIRAGADFAQLARSRSQDSSSATRGGDLGFFASGQMDPAFETAAFALKPGEVSSLVETPYGFHIIKLHERHPPRTVPLTEVRAQIGQYLTDQQRDEMTVDFVEQLKTKGKIEIYV